MKKFILVFLTFSLPFALLLLGYVWIDPYMVVRSHSNYFPANSTNPCSNDAFRGIKLMDLYSDSLNYNSFIIGSSRSDFYYVEEWKKYIGDSAVCFHFNQSGDNLLGASQRIEYLYKRFNDIDNILLIVDPSFLSGVIPNTGHLFMAPYQVTPNNDFFKFHWSFFSAFFSMEGQKRYWYGNNTNVLDYHYIPEYNELHKDGAERALSQNDENYRDKLPDSYQLYSRDTVQVVSEPVIHDSQLALLKRIVELIGTERTRCKVIISPLYDQVKLHSDDLAILEAVFGKENVFDFSGINEFTSDSTNYYENSHYRPCLCNRLLARVYVKRN